MSLIFTYFTMIRPLNVLLSGLTVFIASYLLNHIYNPLTSIIAVVVMLMCAFANMINDLFDVETDKINKPKIYLNNIQLTTKLGKYLILIILLSMLILPLGLAHIYFTKNAILYLYLISFLIIIYTPYLKGIAIIGNIIISYIVASVFIITELILLNSFIKILVYPVLLTFILTLIRELAKDIDDLEGDRTANINTFPVLFGITYSKYLLSILTVFLIIISIYPYYSQIYNFKYLILLVFLVQVPLIGCIFYLWKYPDFQNSRVLTILTKYITIGGVITILSTKLLG